MSATPVCPLLLFALVMTGTESVMIKVTALLPVPPALVAVTVALYVPAAVGMPEMAPVLVLTLSPGGKLDAP